MNAKLLLIPILFLFACKRYKDPSPFTDPRIVNKYCNIPSAINYNWDFPGIPNDSVCVFPAQIYNGNYFFRDSMFNNADLPTTQDSFMLTFTQVDSTKLNITGFCPGKTIHATATRYFKFVIDSVAGSGQIFCNTIDTIAGGGSKLNIFDTTSMRLEYEVRTDTGIIYHRGIATKQ